MRILREASGAGEIAAEAALTAADGDLRAALVSLLAGVGADRARQALDAADGTVRGALTALGVAQHAAYALLQAVAVTVVAAVYTFLFVVFAAAQRQINRASLAGSVKG